MNYALDAGAIIALLDGETGAEVVEDVLTESGSLCSIHLLNLAEICYIYFRRGGQALAESVLQDVFALGIVLRDDDDEAFWKEAVSFKGRHPMSLPDAFCLMLARRVSGTVITSDHGEFDALVSLNYCPILFIR